MQINGGNMKRRGFEVVSTYEDKDIKIPVRKTAKSAAYDLEAAEDVVLPKFQLGIKPTLIPTPHNMGVIDSDYYNNSDNEGHIFIQCINLKDYDVKIKKGEAIAQGIFQKYLIADDDKADGVRAGGFGSTDK